MKSKRVLTLAILAALLGGCAIVPAGYGDNRNGYYQQRDYRDRDNSQYYSYRHDANGDPFQEHGH